MRLIINCIFMLLLSFCHSIMAQSNNNLIAVGEWVPYVSSKMPDQGILTAVIAEAGKRANLNLEFKFFYWPTAYQNTVNGTAMGSFPYYKTPSREKDVFFSDPLIELEEVFFYIQPQIAKLDNFASLTEFKEYKIGGVNGYHYKEDFSQASVKVIYNSTEELAIKKLFEGKVDLVPLNTFVGLSLIKKLYPNNINDFKILKKPLKTDFVYLIVSKARDDAEAFLIAFNQALASMKQDGTIDKILNKANTKD